MSTIGGRIQYARVARGLTQEQLGGVVGVTKGAVSQWESGLIVGLTSENLFRVADAVEASARWLLLGKEKDGRDIPMGKPTHLDPDTADLVDTFKRLPPQAKEELRSDAHKYLRLTVAPQKPSSHDPYPKRPHKTK